jgi:hypothetical protein
MLALRNSPDYSAAMVPQIVQNRAPAGIGAPQPEHFPAICGAGAGASGSLYRGGRSIGAGAGEADAGAAPADWGDGAGAPEAGMPDAGAPAATPGVAAAPGGGATSDWPHDGQVTQSGSSTILRQLGQRFGANGSGWLQ